MIIPNGGMLGILHCSLHLLPVFTNFGVTGPVSVLFWLGALVQVPALCCRGVHMHLCVVGTCVGWWLLQVSRAQLLCWTARLVPTSSRCLSKLLWLMEMLTLPLMIS